MIRRILVVADATEASRVGQAIAIDLARRQDAEITGIGVVDRPWISEPWATPIGAGSYKVHRDESMLQEFRDKVAAILAEFEQTAETADVPFVTVEAEGTPAEAIETEAEAHDLIVIGRDTNFHFERNHDAVEAVARLIRENPRPLLVTPSAKHGTDKVVVGYDGSFPVSRAIHMFVLLGLAIEREVHIVSVAREQDAAEALARRGARLFESHGIKVQLHGTGSHADPAEVLLAEAGILKPGLLVMGAFGHSGLREFILGSTTRTLLDRAESIPLFIHH
jgi:nucleotide-binding universal stress UspA family protein